MSIFWRWSFSTLQKKDGAFLGLVDVLSKGVHSSLILFVLAMPLWAIKIWSHTGIIETRLTVVWTRSGMEPWVLCLFKEIVFLWVLSNFLFQVGPPFCERRWNHLYTRKSPLRKQRQLITVCLRVLVFISVSESKPNGLASMSWCGGTEAIKYMKCNLLLGT